ncbi:hypothetical protein GCM10010466_17910 [Planomonospora alba]|uniref:Uncharacterized protein n=1 Tax=Planomonospora alba TaxID=161354 RepID=A0ABP6MVH6_9ACTN
MTTLEELALRFPGWAIWRSRTDSGAGDWYATRRAYRISQAEIDAGVCMTVTATTLEALGRVLTEQADRQATATPSR